MENSPRHAFTAATGASTIKQPANMSAMDNESTNVLDSVLPVYGLVEDTS